MLEHDLRKPARWWRIHVKYALTWERYTVQTLALAYASARHRTLVI